MRRIANKQILVSNRLVFKIRDMDTGEIITQGKRVGRDCQLTKDEIREYRNGGILKLVKAIRDNRKLSLEDSYHLAKQYV